MKTAALRIFAIGVGVVLLTSAYTRIHSASVMTGAAQAFLTSLTPQQRAQATFQFQDDERFDWHYIPKVRKGLALRDMTPEQKQLRACAPGCRSQPARLHQGRQHHEFGRSAQGSGKRQRSDARSRGIFLHCLRRSIAHRYLGLSRGRSSCQPELHHRQRQSAGRSQFLWNQPGGDPRRATQRPAYSRARRGSRPATGKVFHRGSKEKRPLSPATRRKKF